MADPLVLTLLLDPETQARFDDERTRFFPAARNHLSAHLTLFHALPGEQLDRVRADVRELAATAASFELAVTAVRPLGRGVAYDLRAPELDRLHADLAARFAPWLTRQDRQRFAGHVTVANKLDPDAARTLTAQLSGAFSPWTARATGLGLWWYRGGPWQPLESVALDG